MNLLHLKAAYPSFPGGAEVYISTLSERLVGDGHSGTLVATNAAEVEYSQSLQKRHTPPGREPMNGMQGHPLPGKSPSSVVSVVLHDASRGNITAWVPVIALPFQGK